MSPSKCCTCVLWVHVLYFISWPMLMQHVIFYVFHIYFVLILIFKNKTLLSMNTVFFSSPSILNVARYKHEICWPQLVYAWLQSSACHEWVNARKFCRLSSLLDVLIIIMAGLMMPRMTVLMKCEMISQTVKEFCFFIYLLETFGSIMLTWVVVVVAAVVAGASGWWWQSWWWKKPTVSTPYLSDKILIPIPPFLQLLVWIMYLMFRCSSAVFIHEVLCCLLHVHTMSSCPYSINIRLNYCCFLGEHWY